MSRAGRLAIVAALLAGLTGGCGIPDDTEVAPRGVGPSSGLPTDEDNFQSPPERADTAVRNQFIKNYLQAAVGTFDEASERVRAFLSPRAQVTFQPQELRVVRPTEEPLVNPGSPQVQLRVQQIGVLRANGILEPSSAQSGKAEYTIEVQELSGSTGLYVTDAPQVMLLSDEALATFYRPRTIYFWNRDYTGLVPDVRYMPMTVTREQEPTEIIKWLTAGPSPLLDGTVQKLPAGTSAIGNVPAVKDDKLEINLTGPALPPDKEVLDRVRRQLMWSLRPNLPPGVALELQIDHQVQDVYRGTDYLTSNPAHRLGSVPERFAVYGGRIHRLKKPTGISGEIPVVDGTVNRDLRSAALSSSGTVSYAALVAADGAVEVLRVGAVRAGVQGTWRTTRLPVPIGYPSWAITRATGEAGSASGLVPAGGRLYGFSADDAEVRPVDWDGGPSGITAVSVAPDAHRIAVLAGGRLYIAAMSVTGSGVEISQPRLIRTLVQDLTAVDWSSEGSVVVAGVRYDSARTGRVAIADVSIDGASQNDRLADLGTARVSHLAAYPANPATTTGGAAVVAYEAGNGAYDVLLGPVLITAADLATPVPSGSRPSAPFFLE
jgi:hypothetical protein